MGIKDWFGKLSGSSTPKEPEEVGDDYAELEIPEGAAQFEIPARYVKVFKLKGFADIDVAARELSEGNIVIMDIKPLAERSMNELRHAVDEMKDICISMGGDIAGLSEYHLILTPPNVKIERASESKSEDFEETMERVRRKTAT
jgi:SepF-like predicted cell division protein (DUF552 family)